MSPALMYSLQRKTAASNAFGSKFDSYGKLASPIGATSVSCKSATLLQTLHEAIDALAGGIVTTAQVVQVDVGVRRQRWSC